jgi:hypothetical protein
MENEMVYCSNYDCPNNPHCPDGFIGPGEGIRVDGEVYCSVECLEYHLEWLRLRNSMSETQFDRPYEGTGEPTYTDGPSSSEPRYKGRSE